jgi:hypothetical protein
VAAVVGLLLLCGGVGAAFRVVAGQLDPFGCGEHRPDGVTASDLVGDYIAADGGRLELHADGTMRTFRLGGTTADQPRIPDASGTWKLNPDSKYGDLFLTAGNHGFDADITGTRDNPALYEYIGDPDNCDLYRLNRI